MRKKENIKFSLNNNRIYKPIAHEEFSAEGERTSVKVDKKVNADAWTYSNIK